MYFKRLVIAFVLVSVLVSAEVRGQDAVPASPEARWWRGNIHTHSLWSDGDDFPEMIAEWYRTNGYNFLALSDHNVLSEGMRWMKASEIERRGGDSVIPQYKARFGNGWVETQGDPNADDFAVRLKPLDEFRFLVEERGKFIMIPGEEISDRAEGKPVHMNATNLLEVVQPVGGETVREVMSNNLRAVAEQARQTEREILFHLNHPNFGYGVSAEDIASVVQERFFEVYNGHPGVAHLGDASHPAIEKMWDIVNTIRMREMGAPPILGVGTDDSHNYHGKPGGSYTGRGWVMVRSRYLTPEHIIRAMKRGDFYASSGVYLDDVRFEDKTISLRIQPVDDETFTTQFIGTRRGSPEVGIVLSEQTGRSPSYTFDGDELYVRAMVRSSAPHPNPSFKSQRKQAWTQPMFVK